MRKAAAAVTVALLLSALTMAALAGFASAQTIPININPDGTVSPSNAPIQRFGDLYVLTSDISRTVIASGKSNIVIDGKGHTIAGEPASRGGGTTSGGISLAGVQNVTVKGFSIKDCSIGIYLETCSNIVISGNDFSGTWHPIMFNAISAAISIRGGNYNVITGNRFENNVNAVNLWDGTEYNLFTENTIVGSTESGVRLSQSTGTFYHNNFENNMQDVYDSGYAHNQASSYCAWDNGEQGNFWSNYHGNDANNDGIGDTPYQVDNHNQDRYPLMTPWKPTKIDATPPSISVFSPQNATYSANSIFLNFSTSEPTSWIGYSFDGKENVTISGNATIADLANGLHNVTVYANDTYSNMGASEIVTFTVAVPEPLPILPVAAAAVVFISLGLLILSQKIRPRSGAATTCRSQLRTKCSLNRVNSLFSHTTRWWRNA